MCRNDYPPSEPELNYTRDYNDRWDPRNQSRSTDERDRLDRQIASLERELQELKRRRGF